MRSSSNNLTKVTCCICGQGFEVKNSYYKQQIASGCTDFAGHTRECFNKNRINKITLSRQTPEARRLTSLASKAMWASGNKAKHVAAIKLGMQNSEEYNSSQRIERIKTALNRPEAIAKLSALTKKVWKDGYEARRQAVASGMAASEKYNSPERLAKALQACRKAPTGIEQSIIDFIKDAGLPLRYTGNGTLMVGKLNPDFVSTDGAKKIIDANGCYWHMCKKCFPGVKSSGSIPEGGRHRVYSAAGYTRLVIREHELADDAWKTKLLNFANSKITAGTIL